MYFLGRNSSWPFQNTSTNFIQFLNDYLQFTLKLSHENETVIDQLLGELLENHRELMEQEQYDQLDFYFVYNVASTTLDEMLVR